MNQQMVYPIAPFSSPGKDDVCYWENFLTPEDINLILGRPEWHAFNEARVGGGTGGVNDPNVRRTNISWMGVDQQNQHVWEKITNAIWSANRQFFRFDLTGCYELAQLGAYTDKDQGHYEWHTDSGLETANIPRKLSMAILLSDPSEFEGGELQVLKGKEPFSLEQKKGRAWFFPSWMLHRVTPVTRGLRRSLVLWVGGPAFR